MMEIIPKSSGRNKHINITQLAVVAKRIALVATACCIISCDSATRIL